MDGARFNDGLLEGLLIRRPMNLLELHQIAQGILKKTSVQIFLFRLDPHGLRSNLNRRIGLWMENLAVIWNTLKFRLIRTN